LIILKNPYILKQKEQSRLFELPLHLLPVMRKINSKNILSGFTLLETIIAVFMLVLIATSSLFVLNRGLSIIQTAKNISIASSDALAACESLRYEIDLNGTVASRTYSLANINETETVSISADAYYDPIPVNVSVTWQEEGQRQRTVSIDMLISQRKKN
jgi:type II secretory pathway pseudopilin PulG